MLLTSGNGGIQLVVSSPFPDSPPPGQRIQAVHAHTSLCMWVLGSETKPSRLGNKYLISLALLATLEALGSDYR